MTVSEKIETLLKKRILKEKPKTENWPDFLDLFIQTFLVTRDAPLYIVYLAALQLKPLLNQMVSDLQDIKTYADDRTAPDADPNLLNLSNSKRFLQAYSSAVLVGGVTSTERQSLQRFDEANTAFMNDIKSAAGTELSADEAKTAILASLADLKIQETDLEARIAILLAALSGYQALNLQGQGIANIANRGVRALEAIETRFGAGTANVRDELETVSSLSSTVGLLSRPISLSATALSGTGSASGTGTPAEVTTTVSGPYKLEDDSYKLYLEVDGTSYTTSLTQATYGTATSVAEDGSNEFAISYDAAAPPTPPATRYIRVSVDGGTPANYTITLSSDATHFYCTSASVVSDLSSLPATSAVASDDGATFSIERSHTSNNVTGEDHWITIHIEDIDYTAGSINLGAYLFLGFPPTKTGSVEASGALGLTASDLDYYGEWSSPSVLEEELETESPAVVEIEKTLLGSGDYGESAAGLFYLATIDASSAGDLVISTSSPVITSVSVNFENLGAEAGHRVRYDAGAGDSYGTILSVSGNTITLTANAAITTSVGNATVFPDTSALSTGDVLSITGPDYNGKFKISSAAEEIVTTDTSIPGSLTGQGFRLEREYLTIKSNTTGTSSEVTIGSGTDDAAAELGLTSATDYGEVSEFTSSDSFVLNRVREGDILDVGTTHTISAVGDTLTLSALVPNDTTGSYTITNPDYGEYTTFLSSLTTWFGSYEGLSANIDTILNPLVNAVPPQAVVTNIKSACDGYITAYSSLITFIDAFDCRSIDSVDDLVKLLSASGLNRALTILKMADFSTFFAMDEEDTTYHAYFAKTARQTISEYGNLDKYQDLIRTELRHFVFPVDLQEELDLE